MFAQIIRHFSVGKTEALMRRNFWISNLRQRVEQIIRSFVTRILAERKQRKQEGLLNSIEKGSIPFNTLHVVLLRPLSKTKEAYRHVLAVVEAF